MVMPFTTLSGAVTIPESESMVKSVVEAALKPNDLVPAPRNVMLLRAFEPVIPEIVCAFMPFKIMVPELCVKVPRLRVKFTPTERFVDGAVTVPPLKNNVPEVVAAFAPKVHEPPVPLKVRPLNGDEVATMLFCAVEVELKVTVPVCVKSEVEEANQLPASVRAFAAIVRIDVVAVPSWRRPVARWRSPSGLVVLALPWRVTAPPGANSVPGAICNSCDLKTFNAPSATEVNWMSPSSSAS